MLRSSLARRILALVCLALLLGGASAPAATVPAGFQHLTVATGIASPSALAFAPDGRLFVLEKASGRVRIVKNGSLLATPFLDLSTFIVPPMYLDNFFERGLLGIAFDPSFATNRFVYLYYTLCKVPGSGTCTTAVNRVARFVANGDVVVPGSQTIVLDDIPNGAGNHNAGWIEFGPDGTLYVAVGDGGAASGTAVDLNGLNGKILRINADGTIPANNPFAGQANRRGEIWAYGLRNPWRCRFQPTSGRLFCADVGQNTWEELDIIQPGLNYGWPTTEGPFNPATWPQFTHPIYWYDHSSGRASITGGDFGTRTSFPGDHQQSYYFGDYALGWIKRAILDASGTTVLSVVDFVTAIGTNTVTDIVAGPDGDLYYTDFVSNAVRKVELVITNRSPIAAASADPVKGAAPLTVQFSSAGSSDPDGDPITYSWDFGDGSPLSTQANPVHAYTAEGPYTATLTVSDGQAIPGPVSDAVAIDVGDPPSVTITAPIDLSVYHAGDTVPLAGFAMDAEDGVLPSSALHWTIIFHHDDHTHPFIDDLVGSPRSFFWATSGEPDPDVGYEIILRATDSSGLTTAESVFVVPELGSYTLVSDPPGLQLLLDGQSVSTPLAVTGVIGYPRTLDAPSPQAGNGQTWVFSQWSDGGAKQHAIVPQATARTYTARYVNACTAPTVIPAAGGVFTGATTGDSTLAGTCAKTDTTAERVYAWTPAVSGTATIQTCGGTTAYDTVIYLRSGSCSSGTQVACNDDTAGCSTTSGPNHGSRLTPAVTAGQTYFIVVDGFDGREGAYSLTVTPPAGSPTTTTTAPPTTTTAPPTTTSTTSTSSTTSSSSTSTTVTTTTSSTAVTPPTSTTTSTSTSTSTVAGSGTCANPTVVPAGGGTLTGTTSGTSALAGSCSTSGNSPEKVFRWTPTVSGVATIQTCGTGSHYDTVLYVRDGTCGGSQLACNDDTTGCATASGPNHGSRLTLAVTAGQTYFVVVDGYNGRSGNFALTVTPPDGTCTNQFTVPPQGGTFTGTTAGPSQQTGTCGASDKAPDHVYAWTPSTSGPATISTCGAVTTYDSVLYLRNATCTGAEVSCNDDTPTCATASGPAHGSRLTPTVTAGQTYYIVVDGFNGAKGTYRLTVTAPGSPTTTTTVTSTSTSSTSTSSTTTSTILTTTTSLPPTPTTTSTSSTTSSTTTIPPGTCGSPLVIPAVGGTVAGTTTGTGAQSGTCSDTSTSGETVYAWTPAVSGSVTIQTCSPSTTFDTVLYVRGGACGTGTQLACNDDTTGCGTGDGTPNAARHGSRVTLSAVAGTTYHIFVDGFGGLTGAYQLTVTPGAPATTTTTIAVGTTSTTIVVATTSTTIPPTSTTTSTSSTSTSTTSSTLPPGSCGNPVAIAAAGGTVSGTTSGAGSQAGSCGQTGTAGERVYAWTPAASGIATIQTCSTGTAYDTVLYVRSTACSAASEVACSDDTTGCGTASGPNHGSRITLAVSAGQTYYLVVDGYAGKVGAFNLTVFPPNGTCTNPFTLPAGGGAVSRTTTGGSQQSGTCAASGTSPEVVYRWIPGKSGVAQLETCGSGTNYDTVLYLRSGTCDTGPEVACNDDTCPVAVNDHWGSRIRPTVTAGQTYYVVVDGYNGRSGTFRLNVLPPP